MGELYLRKVVVEIIPQIGTGKIISDLRVEFKCEKTNESSPNKAEINIYNLSEATRSTLEAKNTRVKLSVGYLGLRPGGISNTGLASSSNIELVFVGNVTKVTQDIQSPDIVTKIELADGGNTYRNSRIEKGYPPNTKLAAVLNELIAKSGLSKGPMVGVPTDKKFANGLTLSGLVRDQLNDLMAANGLEWSIQNESIQIIPKGSSTSEQAIFLSPDTGLVGSPSKTESGTEFTSLLQPAIKPGRLVSLQSRFLNGSFKVRKVTHEGDSYSGDFLSKCESTK